MGWFGNEIRYLGAWQGPSRGLQRGPKKLLLRPLVEPPRELCRAYGGAPPLGPGTKISRVYFGSAV